MCATRRHRTGWDERPTAGRRNGRMKLGAARLPRWGVSGGSSPDNVATGRRQRPGRASKAERRRETEPVVEAPILVTGPETGGYGLSWCSLSLSDRERLARWLGHPTREAARRGAVAAWRCHRGIAGRRPCQPVDGERGKRSDGARRARTMRPGAGAPSAEAAGAWRSRRSTPRSGEPATWGRAAASARHARMGEGRR